jgi:guanylate kinase
VAVRAGAAPRYRVTMAKGPLIILSGPSGSGKSTLIEALLERTDLPLRLAVSATTRRPRPVEIDGTHYHFWTPKQFQAEIDAGAFLEWAEVHGNRYGTLLREVEDYRQKGVGVLLDIDVQGAAQVRRRCPDAVAVFLRTSSWETYEQRLRQRGTEDEAAIERRLATARRELDHAGEYDIVIINDNLDTAASQLLEVVRRSFGRTIDAG